MEKPFDKTLKTRHSSALVTTFSPCYPYPMPNTSLSSHQSGTNAALLEQIALGEDAMLATLLHRTFPGV